MLDATSSPSAEERQNVYVHWHNSRILHSDCNVVVRQNSRGTRETVWTPYYSVWSRSGRERGMSETDESSAQSSRKHRHMTQLITAHHPGRDRIQAASSSSCIFKHLHTVLLQLKTTHARRFIYVCELSGRRSRRTRRHGWPYGKIFVVTSFGSF